MSQFYYGLITGFLCSLFLWLIFDGNFEERAQPQVTETTVVEPEPSSFGRSTELVKKPEIVEKVLTQNPSIIIGEQEPACEKEMNCAKVNEKTSRSRILSMLDQLQSEELPLVEKMLKHWNDKIPSEYFQTEKIDSEWSLKKQAELEFTFYDQSALRDLGTLESIECRSRTCQVKVKIPSQTELKPSHYLDWARPISVAINDSEDDSESKIIEIYISREQ